METPVVVVVILLLFVLTRMITVIIHEAGHALAGLILLKGDITVYIGSYGDPKKGIHFKLGRLQVYFKFNPLLWSHGICKANAQTTSLFRNYIFTLAGPLASIITTCICIYIIVFTSIYSNPAIKLTAIFLGFSAIFDFALNLQANEKPIVLYDGSTTYNDGQTLKMLWSTRKTYSKLVRLHEMYKNNEFEKGVELFESSYSKLKDFNLLRLGIVMHMSVKNYTRSAELHNELSSSTALSSEDYCNGALAYSFSGNHAGALELYSESLKLNQDNFYSLNNRAYTYLQIGEYAKAIVDSNRVLVLDSKYGYAYNNRGLSKIKLGMVDEGLADINKSLELDSSNAYAYKNLGIYELDRGKTQNAMNHFLKAQELDSYTHGLIELIDEAELKLSIA
jgi:tetratricopeptide (TPR) repeat protein